MSRIYAGVYMREIKSNVSIPAQIDASIHRILFTINTDNEKAEALANKCYRWMLTEDPTYDVDRHGGYEWFYQDAE